MQSLDFIFQFFIPSCSQVPEHGPQADHSVHVPSMGSVQLLLDNMQTVFNNYITAMIFHAGI